MTLPYELAKQLKDAGWPQPDSYHDGAYVNEEPYTTHFDEDSAYSPSLEELMEACGDEWWRLCRTTNSQRGPFYSMDTLSGHTADGATPKETVAQLWLKLQEKREPEGGQEHQRE